MNVLSTKYGYDENSYVSIIQILPLCSLGDTVRIRRIGFEKVWFHRITNACETYSFLAKLAREFGHMPRVREISQIETPATAYMIELTCD